MIELPEGKRIPNLEEYTASLISIDCHDDNASINEWGAYTDNSNRIITPVKTSEGFYRFMPGPEFGPRIYRGQTEYHRFCTPSAFRDNKTTPIFDLCKLLELGVLVLNHPAMRDIMSLTINKMKFDLHLESIGQHYGYKTRLLDFSRSKDVAMFFATCRYNRSSSQYEPLSYGRVVLYTVDLKKLLSERLSDLFIPLGFEPLPRPLQQQAIALSFTQGENLNDMPWVKKEKFDVTSDLSDKYYRMFDGGARLFPLHPFDKLIEKIRCCNDVHLDALLFGLIQSLLPPSHGIFDLKKILERNGHRVTSEVLCADENIMREAGIFWEKTRPDFFNRIRIRGVTDHYM